MQFHEKKFDLFDSTSFFAQTFLNFLAFCETQVQGTTTLPITMQLEVMFSFDQLTLLLCCFCTPLGQILIADKLDRTIMYKKRVICDMSQCFCCWFVPQQKSKSRYCERKMLSNRTIIGRTPVKLLFTHVKMAKWIWI